MDVGRESPRAIHSVLGWNSILCGACVVSRRCKNLTTMSHDANKSAPLFLARKMKDDQFTKQVRHDLQNARKTTARWITNPNGNGRPQPRETKESAHQSHPTPATPPVRKQTSEQPRNPGKTTIRQACSTRFRIICGSLLALALAQRDEQNQNLRRPVPASLQRQDHKPGSVAKQQKLKVGPLLPASCLDQNCTIKRRCPTVGCTVRVQRTHKSSIHGQLCTWKERQAVCDHLEPSIVHQVRNIHVKVPHKQISGDSATGLSADLRSALKGKIPSPTRLQATRWWPREARRRPHRQKRREKGRGRRRRRNKRTLKNCGSMRVCKLEGVVVNATPAPVPLCDRVKALSASVN